MTKPPDLADIRYWRSIHRLHACGPRVVGELLREIGADRSSMTAIEALIERYTSVEPIIHRQIGSDSVPTPPIHRVSRR